MIRDVQASTRALEKEAQLKKKSTALHTVTWLMTDRSLSKHKNNERYLNLERYKNKGLMSVTGVN